MHANLGAVWGLTQPSGAAAASPAGAGEGKAVQGVPDGPARQPSASGPCGGQDPMVTILMMLAMFAVFYFLLIRPQSKKAKEHQNMLAELKKGDDVVTGGGIVGKVTGVSDKLITLEVSEKVRVRVIKSQVIDKFKE